MWKKYFDEHHNIEEHACEMYGGAQFIEHGVEYSSKHYVVVLLVMSEFITPI